MPVLGITGGIATGKSTFTRSLLRYLPADLFDADACARELLEENGDIHRQLRESFGPEVFDPRGMPDRLLLRARVFSDERKRHQLEAILHPAIRQRWSGRAEMAKASGDWLCVDIPLLFETASESHFDRVIVVACATATQRARLRESRGLSDELAGQMIEAQLDLESKMTKADHLIWNDSAPANLDRQAALLAGWLRQRYG
jgi:dephospho-CoA kinase